MLLRIDALVPRGLLARDRSRSRQRDRVGIGAALPTSVTVPGTSYQAKLPSVTAADVANAMPPDLQGAYASFSASYDANATAQTGAASAMSLVEHGFDPTSANDQAAIVHVYAGAVSLVPVVGPILGGVVEASYQMGQALAKWPPMQQLMGLCADPRGCCQSSGNWTTAQAWTLSGTPKPYPGTFAALIAPALYDAWVHAQNCDRTSFWNQAYTNMLPVLVGLWNKFSKNQVEDIDYFVPLLNALDRQAAVADAPPLGRSGPGSALAAQLGLATPLDGLQGPLAYPTPGAVNSLYAYANQGHWAFQPVAYVPRDVLFYGTQSLEGITWSRIKAKAGPMMTLAEYYASLPSNQPTPQVTATVRPLVTTSDVPTSGKIALAVGGTVVAAAAAGSIYALVQKHAVGYFWGKIFDQVVEGGKGLYRRASGG